MTFGSFIDKNFKAIAVVLVFVIGVCGIASIIIFSSKSSIKETRISINYAPTNVKVTVGDREYVNGAYIIEPGEYKVEIRADGFKEKTVDVVVKEGNTAVISGYLVNENEGMSYYERNQADIDILKSLNQKDDSELSLFLSNYEKKIAIFYDLPIDASYEDETYWSNLSGHTVKVSITDGSLHDKCEKAFCLLVSGIRINFSKVAEAIKSRGYNAEDYFIIYDYVSDHEGGE